jgi:hypothetical protein
MYYMLNASAGQPRHLLEGLHGVARDEVIVPLIDAPVYFPVKLACIQSIATSMMPHQPGIMQLTPTFPHSNVDRSSEGCP